ACDHFDIREERGYTTKFSQQGESWLTLFACNQFSLVPYCYPAKRVINAHPLVQQAFVVPVEDKEFGHRPVAVVEYASQAGDVNLAEWVRDKLARFQQPVRWLTLPSELKNGGIKISRRALQQWVCENCKN
ncbi:hypothetical protein MJI95_26135, partial [Salmonella enterica subsp. enterica serovar Kentucky]|nr:hypothetical protein [Salmonella enterica subsp. enterica serovar Kentucky]